MRDTKADELARIGSNTYAMVPKLLLCIAYQNAT